MTPTQVDKAPSLWSLGDHICHLVDPAIYPTDAAVAAGYKFTDRAYVWLESAADGAGYYVFLRSKSHQDDLLALSGAFINELLDQSLRLRLERQFGPLRTLIVAQAFSEGDLLG